MLEVAGLFSSEHFAALARSSLQDAEQQLRAAGCAPDAPSWAWILFAVLVGGQTTSRLPAIGLRL